MSGAAVATGGKLAVLANFGCQVEDIDLEEGKMLDWEFHPTTIGFGGGNMRFFTAASVLNPLIVLAAAGILVGLAFAVKLVFDMPFGRALGNCRTPGMIFIPFMFILPGTSLVAAKLGLPPTFSDFAASYALFLLIACVLSPFVVWGLVCRNLTKRATTLPDPALHVGSMDGEKDVKTYTGFKRTLYLFAFGDRIWVSQGEDSYFVEQYGVVFESYKEGRTWWVIVECAIMVAIGVLSIWQPGSPGECNTRNGIFTAVFGLFFILLLVVRPYLSLFDAVMMGLIAGLMFVAVLLMTIGIGGEIAGDSAIYSAAGVLLLVTTVLTAVKAVFDILVYGTDIWMGRKSGARDMNRQQESKENVMLAEVGPVGGDALAEQNILSSAALLPPRRSPTSLIEFSSTKSSESGLYEPLNVATSIHSTASQSPANKEPLQGFLPVNSQSLRSARGLGGSSRITYI